MQDVKHPQATKRENIVTIGQSGKIILQGSELEVNTATVDVNAATSDFSGPIKTTHITTESIASKSYTPGASNIW